MSTGHRCKETTEFFIRLYGSNLDIQINKSILSLIGKDQPYNVELFAHESLGAAEAAGI